MKIAVWHIMYLWNKDSAALYPQYMKFLSVFSPNNDGASSDNNVLCPSLLFTTRPSSTAGNLTSRIKCLPTRQLSAMAGGVKLHVRTSESVCVCVSDLVLEAAQREPSMQHCGSVLQRSGGRFFPAAPSPL